MSIFAIVLILYLDEIVFVYTFYFNLICWFIKYVLQNNILISINFPNGSHFESMYLYY